MPPKLPLNTTYLNKIKTNIKQHAETFQIERILISQIGFAPAGRMTTESALWPVEEAIDFFTKEGAIRRIGAEIEILRDDYFNISFSPLDLPITFPIDKRIEADLKIMSALYAVLYDTENRIRFHLEERLIATFGTSFASSLPSDVRNSIKRERARPRWYITESRSRELNFAQFSDLIAIVGMPGLLSNRKEKTALIERLRYLNEARTRIAHNNIVPSGDVQKIKDYAEEVKRLVTIV